MRKVSRAQEQVGGLNYRTAADRCEGPNCWNAPEPGRRHCTDCAEKVKNPTSRPYEAAKQENEKHEDHYKYIKKQGDSWVVIQKGTGKVLSNHDSREKAIASFKAMMMNKHGSVVLAKTWPAKADDTEPTAENPWYKSSAEGQPEEWDYYHEDPEVHGYGSTIVAPMELPGGKKILFPYETGLGSYINVSHHPDKGLWEAAVGEAGPGGREMHSSFHTNREDAMSMAYGAWQTHFPRALEFYPDTDKHIGSKTNPVSFDYDY